jgi:hypothetical protein
MGQGTEGPRDWLGIVFGLGSRKTPGARKKKGGCFPVILLLAVIGAGIASASARR